MGRHNREAGFTTKPAHQTPPPPPFGPPPIAPGWLPEARGAPRCSPRGAPAAILALLGLNGDGLGGADLQEGRQRQAGRQARHAGGHRQGQAGVPQGRQHSTWQNGSMQLGSASRTTHCPIQPAMQPDMVTRHAQHAQQGSPPRTACRRCSAPRRWGSAAARAPHGSGGSTGPSQRGS